MASENVSENKASKREVSESAPNANENNSFIRKSINQLNPFHPEFNAFYPIRPLKYDTFDFFDDECDYEYGITRILLKLRESLQIADEFIWSKRFFRFTVMVTLSSLVVVGILKTIFTIELHKTLSTGRMVLFLLLLSFAYGTSFLRPQQSTSTNNINQSNFKTWTKEKLSGKSTHLEKGLQTLDSLLRILRTRLPITLRAISSLTVFFISLHQSQDKIIPSLCVLLGILVCLFSVNDINVENLSSLLTSLVTTLSLVIIMFETSSGIEFLFFWYNFFGTHSKQLGDSLSAALNLKNEVTNCISPEVLLIFFNPLFVAIAAMLFHVGLHKFFFIIISQMGVFFYRAGTVVMGCCINCLLFDFSGYLLWMSPLLSMATDHQIALITVSTATCLTLPLSFSIAHRYGLRYPFIVSFGPINLCVAIIVVKCMFPCRGTSHLKLNMNLLERRKDTDFFEMITVAVADSAKFLLIHIGGYVVGNGINNLCTIFKASCDVFFRRTVMGASFIDDAMYAFEIPIMHLLGFPEHDMRVVSKFLFRNFIIFNTGTIDDLMHYVGIRWIAECWTRNNWQIVDYDSRDVFLKSTYENSVFFHIPGTILDEKTEFLLMHLLMNFVSVTYLFTFCAAMAVLLPHKVVNIRVMMGSMFTAMFLSLFASNILIRMFYRQSITGLWCVGEKYEPLCTDLMRDLTNHTRFNGSILTIERSLSTICHAAIKKNHIFPRHSISLY